MHSTAAMQEGDPSNSSGGISAPPVAALAAAAVAAATGQAAAVGPIGSHGGAMQLQYPPQLHPPPLHHPSSSSAQQISAQQIAAQQQQIVAAAHAHNIGVAAAAAAAASSKPPVLFPDVLGKVHPAVRLFENWMQASPVHSASYRPLHDLPVETLLAVIGDWITEAHKSNGGTYSPDTLYVYLSSLQRHVRRTHGQPHFNFLDSLPVRSAMEKKFGAEAIAHLLPGVGGGAQRPKREATEEGAEDEDEDHDGADSAAEAAAAGDKTEHPYPPKPHFPPLLSRKRKGGKANAKGRKSAGSAAGASSSADAKRSMTDAASASSSPGWLSALGSANSTEALLSFKPVKPSHSHRSFRGEQRFLNARQDPSTPEGLLRCLLWIMFTHVPNLTRNACWNLKVNQFAVRTMQGDGSDVRDAPEPARGDAGAAAAATATGEGKTIRFLQFTQSRKIAMRGEGPPEIIMYEQPTMRHCCPVTLYQQYMAHRPHRAIEISGLIRRSMCMEKPPGEETDAGSFLWLLTRKHLETTGDDAGVWYANRRVGQSTMDRLIALVRLSRNQPPLEDHDALAARAERIDAEDQEEGGEGNADENAADDSADHSNQNKRAKNHAASVAAAAASSSAAAAAAAAPSSSPAVARMAFLTSSAPGFSHADLARMGISMGPAGIVLPPNAQVNTQTLYINPGMALMPQGVSIGQTGTAQGDLMMRQNLAYNLQQALGSQTAQQLGLAAPNAAAMASMGSAVPWAAAAAAAFGASGSGSVSAQQVQLAEQALMKKITADRADAHNNAMPRGHNHSSAAANAAAASASAAAAAAASSPATAAAASSSSRLKSAFNGNGTAAALVPSPPLGAESLPAVNEYLRAYGQHLRDLKATVAALEASLARVQALVTGNAVVAAATVATTAPASSTFAPGNSNAPPTAAAAHRDEEHGDEEEEEDMEQED